MSSSPSFPASVPAPASPERPLPTVRLRVPTDEDAHAWHRVFDDADVMEFLGGPAELSFYEEITARQRMHDAQLGYCLWTLLDEDDQVIGFTGAQPWPRDWGPVGEIEIGWRLGRGHWGRGYAYAAALATVERVRAAGVPHVVAMIHARNARSVAVAERLGMELAQELTSPTGNPARRYRLDLTPVEAAPVEAAPVEAAPVEAAPVEAAPVEAAPVDAAPVDAAPVEAAPVDAAPVDAAPVEAAPVEAAPVEA